MRTTLFCIVSQRVYKAPLRARASSARSMIPTRQKRKLSSIRCSASALSTPRAGWQHVVTSSLRVGQLHARHPGALQPEGGSIANEQCCYPTPRETGSSKECGASTPASTPLPLDDRSALEIVSAPRYLSHEVATSTIHMPQRCSN